MKDTTKIIAFIGAGNMVSAIIGGIIKMGYPPDKLWVSAPTTTHLYPLRDKYNINISQNNKDVANIADVIILAVKPLVMKNVAIEITPIIKKHNPLMISVMAAIEECLLREWLGHSTAIVRCMPNTPITIGYGVLALYANHFVTNEQKSFTKSLFQPLGLVLWLLNEQQMNAVSALSGCGPAYFYMVMEAMSNAAVHLGLPHQIAEQLVLQTALGSAKLAIEKKQCFSTLTREVASPGGGTERALMVLTQGGIKELFASALRAANDRFEELSAAVKNENE